MEVVESSNFGKDLPLLKVFSFFNEVLGTFSICLFPKVHHKHHHLSSKAQLEFLKSLLAHRGTKEVLAEFHLCFLSLILQDPFIYLQQLSFIVSEQCKDCMKQVNNHSKSHFLIIVFIDDFTNVLDAFL
jgi:hypothetical protein